MQWQHVKWTSDSRALTFIRNLNGASNVWSYDLAGGASQQLTDFKADQIFSYDWSADFRQLACERGNNISDVILFSGGN